MPAMLRMPEPKSRILLGNGDGTFRPHVEYHTGYLLNGINVADLNADGRADAYQIPSSLSR
jgi:hypothetical protein